MRHFSNALSLNRTRRWTFRTRMRGPCQTQAHRPPPDQYAFLPSYDTRPRRARDLVINSCSSTLATPARLQSIEIWPSMLVRGCLPALPRPTTQICTISKYAPGKHWKDQSSHPGVFQYRVEVIIPSASFFAHTVVKVMKHVWQVLPRRRWKAG